MATEPINAALLLSNSDDRRRRAGWMSWFSRSTLSVIDQGLVSGSNFVLNVMLARWLEPQQYGAYALGCSVFLLLTGFYQSLVLEPMAVLGPNLFADRHKRYLGALLRSQLALLLAVCGVLAAAAVFIARIGGKPSLGTTLAGLALAAPAIFVFGLARGACYLRVNIVTAVQGAALYSAVLLSGVAIWHYFHALNGFTAFLIMGAASAAVSAHLLRTLAPEWNPKTTPTSSEVALEHWRFGRWELARVGFDWAGENISYALTAAFLGMSQVGALKAILTLFLPLSHILTALRRLILPHLSSVSGSEGISAANASIKTVNLINFALCLVNCFILVIFGRTIFRMLYGGRFMEVAWLVPWAGLTQVFASPVNGFDMGLRALRSPATVFTASASGAAVSLILYAFGTRMFGLPGTIAANVCAAAAYTVITGLLYHRRVAACIAARS
jgi:O-antigen/teichoic acid export membrane protein